MAAPTVLGRPDRPQSVRVAPPPIRTPPSPGFDAALARHAMSWHQIALTEPEVAQQITRSITALIPGAGGAAILIVTGGEPTMQAAHGALPDLDVLPTTAEDRPSTLRDLPACPDWPIFTAPAGPSGQDRVLCTPLGLGRTMFGTLIVAAERHPDHTTTTSNVAAMLATLAMHASTALAAARQRDTLHAAIESRDVIGQAKGILMQRRRITADTAFNQLTRLSQNSNTKLRDLCTRITQTGEIPDSATHG
jgi:GAF domain-containing protein